MEHFSQHGHFNTLNCSNPWTCEDLLPFIVFYHFFFYCFKLSCKKSFAYLVKFIPRYFVAIVIMTYSLISLSEDSLLTHEKGIYFCMVIFYHTTLLNLFISFNSLWINGIIWSCKKDMRNFPEVCPKKGKSEWVLCPYVYPDKIRVKLSTFVCHSNK
jgi:hypothetical protein